jgi:hypothetical protein
MNSQTKALKSKIIGGVANALSAPSQIKAKLSKSQADSDVKTIKQARAYDKAPDNADGGRAGMARSLAQDVKDRLTGKYK